MDRRLERPTGSQGGGGAIWRIPPAISGMSTDRLAAARAGAIPGGRGPRGGDSSCPAGQRGRYSLVMSSKAALRVASLALVGLAASCVFELRDPLSSTPDAGSDAGPDPCADAPAGMPCCEPGAEITCTTGAPSAATGTCKPGVRTCLADGSGYGACEGEVTPVIQNCMSEADTDCNGKGCSGDTLWVRHFGSASNESANGVAIDRSGDVLVAGTFDGTLAFGGLEPLTSKGGTDIFLVKLDPEGVPLWSRRFGGAGVDEGGTLGRGPMVAVDAEGNVVVTGAVLGTADLGDKPVPGSPGDVDPFVVKMSGDGALLWSKRFEAAGEQRAWGAAIDAEGSVILTGAMTGTMDFGGGELTSAGGKDLFVVKLDKDGKHVWSRRLGGDNDQQGMSLAVGLDGAIAVTGDLIGTMTFDADEGIPPLASENPEKTDILVFKLDPSGKALWGHRFGKGELGGDILLQRAGGVAVAPSGHVLVTGWFHSSLKLDSLTVTSAGKSDVFVVRFEKGGTVNWLTRYGNDLDYQVGWSVTSDAAGQVLLTGNLTGDVALGPLMHKGFDNTTSSPDGYALKLNAQLDPVWTKSLVGPGWQVGYGIAADTLGSMVMVGRTDGDITSLDPPIKNQGGDDIVMMKLAP